MILFVRENRKILFLRRITAVGAWITEIVDRVSKITVTLVKESRINGN